MIHKSDMFEDIKFLIYLCNQLSDNNLLDNDNIKFKEIKNRYKGRSK